MGRPKEMKTYGSRTTEISFDYSTNKTSQNPININYITHILSYFDNFQKKLHDKSFFRVLQYLSLDTLDLQGTCRIG